MATRVKKEKKFFRQCPKCSKKVGHTTAASRDRSVKLNSICNPCSRSISLTGKKRGPMSAETKAKLSAAQTGKTHTAESRAKMSDSHKGSPNPHYQSVRVACTKMYGENNVYPRHHFTEWAIQVKERDNYTCNRCDTEATGHYIHAHHVSPKEFFPNQALNIDNGVTLCSSCHHKIHAFLDKLTLSGVKLDAEGFQTHTSRFINGNKPTNVPTEYKNVFSPSVTIVKE